MDRTQKEGLVTSLREGLEESSIVIVTQQKGLTVSEVTSLRAKIREAGANHKVVKNTLARLAVVGTAHEGLKDSLSGPTALTYSSDPVATAKALMSFANDNDKLKVIAAVMDGNILDAKAIDTLSKLPSLDELRAKLLAIFTTPATQIARISQEPATQLARVFAAYGKSA